ncbi:MAG: SIMPL domain-containing protein, partial [Anaerolineaceae bacterium]|nr:SIMPL domain-containing protein [Anaerolineaceae bacterium]
GVEAQDIQTTSFNVYPMQDYGMDGTISRSYYVVENTVYITVRDLSKLGTLLDAVVKSGANTINSISFDVQDKAEAMAQARDMAIANAIAEAESIAKASGVKLGNLQYVSAYVNNFPMPMYDGKGGSMSAAVNVPISAGQLVISASASMTYEIN